MQRKIAILMIFLFCGVWLMSAEARVGRGGGGARAGVQNRSAGASRGNISSGNVSRQNVPRTGTNINRGADRNVNRDINRDVNRDIDRDVDIDGGWGGYHYDDPGWGWGSFAAGAAAGAITGAVVNEAYDDDDTVIINTPSTGSYVSTLPPGCADVSSGGDTMYDCNGVLYQPFYQGSTLVYQVVP